MSDDAKKDEKLDREHPDYPGMTYRMVADAKKRARAKIEEERSAAALKKIEEAEYKRLAEEEGVVGSGEPQIEITLNLAPDMKDIRLDGKIYVHRGKYKVRSSIAAVLLEQQYRGWKNESTRKGEDAYAFYAQAAQATKEPTVINGRTGVLAGTIPGAALAR